MASTAGSRTGLITATVIAVIVALTALVFAFIFSAGQSKAQAQLEDLQKRYANVIAPNALNGPVVLGLDERRKAGEPFSPNTALLEVAVGERDQLTKLIGGASPAIASKSAKDALKTLSTQMKDAGLGEINTEENLAGTITQAGNAIASLHSQNQTLRREAELAQSRAAEAVKAAAAQIEANNKQLADVRAAALKEGEAVAAERLAQQGVLSASAKTFEDQNRTTAEAMNKLSQQLSDAERDRQRAEKELAQARTKLASFRPDAEQSVIRRADGTITRIATDRTVYIDLGAGQQIAPGMTFEVYNKIEGVPALKADETSLPMGKASIEVVRVTANSSECRVVRTKPGETITEGDVIANLVYDRNTKYKFAVYGKFDLNKKGTPEAADAATIKRLVNEFGGEVQDKIGVDTDFLVIGAEPQIPDFTEEQRRDPVNAKVLADAQAEVDAYNATLNRAKELFIPVLNQNRFLYYVGYFDLARR